MLLFTNIARPPELKLLMAPQASANLAGIDSAIGLSNCLDKVELFEKLLRMFVSGQGAIIDQVRQTLSQGETEKALRIAHTLKSNAATIGALALAAASAKLESTLGEGSSSETDLADTEHELRIVLSGIETHFSQKNQDI